MMFDPAAKSTVSLLGLGVWFGRVQGLIMERFGSYN